MADEKLNILTLAMAKKYTDNSLAGAGAVAGVPCQIQSITPITGGNRVTFLWVDNNNVSHTSTLDVMDGAGGEENKIDSISVNGSPISIDENKNVDITVPEEYVTDTELEAKGYLTEHQDISGKVDKVEGKSLISDTEIARLASVYNYDDTEVKGSIEEINSNLGELEKKNIPGVQNYLAAKARYSNTDCTHNNTNYFATFLHITDIHDDAMRYKRAREIADYIKVDGVLMTGDMVAGVGTDDFSFVTDIEDYFSTPLYTAVGNHDRYGLDEDTAFTKYYSLFANKYNYKTIAGTSGMNYYVDLADKKLRIISLNLYGYVDRSTVKGYYPHYRQDYIIALTSILNSTPANYGVIIICHAPEKGLNRSYDYDIFKQPETFFWTDGSEYTTLTEIVDAFISRSSISKTHINTMTDNSSITVNADFSSVNSGVEFIGWVTGHTHTDNIAYVPNTANKQLMLNMACSGLQQNSTYDINYYNDLGRDEYCETQDLLNAYIIDRENKVVKVVRIGAHLTYDLVDRNYMAIPYAD